MRTTHGEMVFEFAYDNWVMLAWQSRTLQRRCHSRKDLENWLIEVGLPESEAGSVAHQTWASRPLDASTVDSISMVRSIGNQWLVGLLLIVLLVGVVIAYFFALTGSHY